MQGKTHLVAGTATALAIMQPASIPLLLIGTAAAGAGGILPDIDVGSSHAAKGVAKAVVLTVVVGGIVYLADRILGLALLDTIRADQTAVRMIAGYICFLALCGVGGATEHRTMTHSFLYALFTTCCVYIIYPDASLYFLIGYVSHLMLDLLNKKGEQLLWPLKNAYNLGWFRSDGMANKLLFYMFTVCTLWLMLTNSALIAAVQSTNTYAANVTLIRGLHIHVLPILQRIFGEIKNLKK